MTLFDLPYGIHRNVEAERYHQRISGVVSKGALDQFARSPAHYRAWLETGSADTPAFVFGRAFHCALLEPDLFEQTYAAEPDFGDCRRKENKARRDAWREDNGGRISLGTDDSARIRGMIAAVRRHPLASKMMRDGVPEVTVTWQDSETDLPCKIRGDWWAERLRMVIDAKSCFDASPDAFRKDVARYRYHVQDALYRSGFAAAGKQIDHFVFVAVEKEPPYAVGVYSLDPDGIGRGYTRARIEIDRMAECVSRNDWPAYSTSIQTLELPPWAA
jgi:hypothetical protein